jgi:hypothetical protein
MLYFIVIWADSLGGIKKKNWSEATERMRARVA